MYTQIHDTNRVERVASLSHNNNHLINQNIFKSKFIFENSNTDYIGSKTLETGHQQNFWSWMYITFRKEPQVSLTLKISNLINLIQQNEEMYYKLIRPSENWKIQNMLLRRWSHMQYPNTTEEIDFTIHFTPGWLQIWIS